MVSLLCLLRQGSGQSHVREGPKTHLGAAANQEGAPNVLLLRAWGPGSPAGACRLHSSIQQLRHAHTPLSLPVALLPPHGPFLPCSMLPLPGPSICLAAPAVLASSLSHTLRRDHPDFLLPFPFPLLLPLVYIFLPPPSSFLPSSTSSSNLDGPSITHSYKLIFPYAVPPPSTPDIRDLPLLLPPSIDPPFLLPRLSLSLLPRRRYYFFSPLPPPPAHVTLLYLANCFSPAFHFTCLTSPFLLYGTLPPTLPCSTH